MKLQETFGLPEARVTCAVMFIDLTDSTAMKESKVEAHWLPTLGLFYDIIAGKIAEYGGSIVKYTGDGAMIVFDADHVAEAINAAISVQEALIDARNSDLIDCYASIGIATGRTVRFAHFREQEDYVGTVVDLASRLCSAASSQAILVDTATIAHANMGKVVSRNGRFSNPPRSAQQYLGEEHTFEAKGFKNRVRYHQIFWADHPFGLKPDFVENEIRSDKHQETQPQPQPQRTQSLEELLTKVQSLWNSGDREEALDLCMYLSKSGSREADDLIFQMAKSLLDESIQEDNEAKVKVALGLLQYAAKEGHQAAIRMIEEWIRRTRT